MKQVIIGVITFLYTCPLFSQEIELIKDINPLGASSEPFGITYINGYALFIADDGINGRELWKTNGTAGGTMLVKDIYTGSSSSIEDTLTVEQLAVMGDTLFFVANDGINGKELWISDGTAANTHMVKDIRSGAASSHPYELVVIGNTLFFQANNGSEGVELWKSDGTEAGTVLVKDINPAGSSNPLHLEVWQGTLYFSATSNDTEGTELWKSDGTEAGTVLVKDINPVANQSSHPEQLTALESYLFFVADDGTNGPELWKSNGTEAGTLLVKDIYTGVSPAIKPENLTALADTLFFTATDTEDNKELWRTDGTEVNTYQVKDIHGSGSSHPENLTAVDTLLYFSADDGINGLELWRSDGTAAGTQILDIHPSGSSNPAELTAVDGTLFLTAESSVTGREIWTINHVSGEAELIADILEGSYVPLHLTNMNGTLLFSAGNIHDGTELWKSDGTEAGTVLVKNINEINLSGTPSYLTPVDDVVFFLEKAGSYYNLWKTDGTEAGTQQVKTSLSVWVDNNSANAIISKDGMVYFTATHYTNGFELWKSDGTEAGTVMVKDIYSGLNSSYPKQLTLWNGHLFFIVSTGGGFELWKSDGTAAGTVMVKSLGAVSPSQLTATEAYLYFAADDGTSGKELWKSDGTTGGTLKVKDIFPGAGGSAPEFLTPYQNKLYFCANDNTHEKELWVSDGTAAGTTLVKDIQTIAAGGAAPKNLTVVDNTLYFSANDGINGLELWKTDGTASGTLMVKDITPGNNTTGPTQLFSFYDTLYFVANDGTNGRELWKTDGSETGTLLVKDIFPGSEDSNPQDLITFRGKLYFTAEDGSYGKELWVSNGISDSTKRVADIYTGSSGSSPNFKTVLGDALLFGATTNLGNELWKCMILNTPPTAKDSTITLPEDSLYTFSSTFISFSDLDYGDTLHSVQITSDISAGQLFLDSNGNKKADGGETVTVGTHIEPSDLTQLTFIPATNAYGNHYANFRFKVYDGKDYSHDDYPVTFHVTPLADTPQATDALTTFGAFNSFGLEITPHQEDGSEITYFKISTIEGGALFLSDGTTPVHNGDFITAADATAGLKFMPDAAGSGRFDVQASIGNTEAGLSPEKTTANITISKASQTIAFDELTQKVYGADPMELVAVASSGLPVSFHVTGPATLNNHLLTITGSGTISVEALQTGNANYKNATTVVRQFEVIKANQTIDMPLLQDKTYGDTPFALTATATSGLPISFSVSGPAEVNGNLLTLTGSGTVSITAYQSGNVNYHSAPSLTTTFEVLKAAQFITLAPIADQVVGESITLFATASSGLPVSFSVEGPANLTNGNRLKLKEGGQVTVKAVQVGNQNYKSADTVSVTFQVSRLAQTIAFPPLPSVNLQDTVILAASATSGLDVTFTVEGPAVLEDHLLIVTGEGNITVTASQEGNHKYAAAKEIVQTLQVTVTGVEQVSRSFAFNIFPNPTTGPVNIHLEDPRWRNSSVTVTDILGQTVISKQMDKGNLQLDMSTARAGLYFVIIKNEGKSKTFRILKR